MRFQKIILLTILILGTIGVSACSRDEGASVPQTAQRGAADAEKAVSSERAGVAPQRSSILGQEPELSPPKAFLRESLSLQRVELAPEALAVWRAYSAQKPALLILSDDPMIAPVPAGLRSEALRLAAGGSRAEFARRSFPEGSNPLIMPGMAVGLALEAGYFEELYWALPFRNPDQEMNLTNFRKEYQVNGLLDKKEAASLTLKGKALHGVVRKTPFVGASLQNLPELNRPVILHIDQSYFRELYKNDISTPLLRVVYNTINFLRVRNIPVLAVTFSYGNLDDRIGLDVRFIGDILATVIHDPSMVDQPPPANWQRQERVLYLINFFQEEMVEELTTSMEKDAPNSAWIKFGVYRAKATTKKRHEALAALEEAVALDRVYAMEYRILAEMAYKNGRKDEALRMVNLAAKFFPENALIQVQQAELSMELEDLESARKISDSLKKLSWSKEYYPNMQDFLERFSKSL